MYGKVHVFVNNKTFQISRQRSTKTLESKVQRSLRKLKSKLSPYEYKKLYPTGSCPGKFYGTAKLHNLPANGKTDDLPIRPIVSNINTATYQLLKHLSKVLSPLRESEHNIFFFYLGFLSQTFTIYRTAGEGGGYFCNSSLPLPPSSQTLRDQPGNCCRELTSAHSQQPDSNLEPLVSKHKSLTTKIHAL